MLCPGERSLLSRSIVGVANRVFEPPVELSLTDFDSVEGTCGSRLVSVLPFNRDVVE